MKARRLLYLLLFTLILLLLCADNVAADTPVSGFIESDTTWTLESSPYLATGNILVNQGVALTIEPGVTVKFDSEFSLQIEGELVARGTESQKIIFTSNQLSPAPGDWGYILFSDTSTDATFDVDGNYTSGSVLEYCVVEYAGGASIEYNGTVKIDNAYPFINHCTIQYNTTPGITARNITISGTFKITNNTISHNTPQFNLSLQNGAGGGLFFSISFRHY